MKRPNRRVKRTGFSMSDREIPKTRHCHHGFIPAEEYVRHLPLSASMANLAAAHILDSKRPVRSIADMLGVQMLGRDRMNPLLRQRQTMTAIAEESCTS